MSGGKLGVKTRRSGKFIAVAANHACCASDQRLSNDPKPLLQRIPDSFYSEWQAINLQPALTPEMQQDPCQHN
ncbi:hypothetical protein DS878_11830 [Marinobacter sp. F3R11]|nr:hypothetical protein DS878_11830 [Marinobacter sp. F3R11]